MALLRLTEVPSAKAPSIYSSLVLGSLPHRVVLSIWVYGFLDPLPNSFSTASSQFQPSSIEGFEHLILFLFSGLNFSFLDILAPRCKCHPWWGADLTPLPMLRGHSGSKKTVRARGNNIFLFQTQQGMNLQ